MSYQFFEDRYSIEKIAFFTGMSTETVEAWAKEFAEVVQ